MNEEQSLRLRLYNEATERGSKNPMDDARRSFTFIMTGAGVRKSKKSTDAPTVEIFPEHVDMAASIRESADILRAAGISPPQIEETRVVLVKPPEAVPTMTDEQLRDQAAERAAALGPVNPETGLMGVAV